MTHCASANGSSLYLRNGRTHKSSTVKHSEATDKQAVLAAQAKTPAQCRLAQQGDKQPMLQSSMDFRSQLLEIPTPRAQEGWRIP